jgi:hypothetical protein
MAVADVTQALVAAFSLSVIMPSKPEVKVTDI